MVEWLREFSQEHMLATLIITILFWGTVFWFLFKFSIKVIVFIIRFFMPFKYYYNDLSFVYYDVIW